jgi:phage gp36-like protein
MSWITIAQDDIEKRLAAAEMTAVTSAATQVGQTPESIIASAIAAVTGEIRGYVAACQKNVLGETGTIPGELEGAALAMIRRYLFTRLPGTSRLLDENRRKETEDAIALLRDVAAGKFAIVAPAAPAPAAQQASGPASQVVSSPDRTRRPSQTAGL